MGIPARRESSDRRMARSAGDASDRV